MDIHLVPVGALHLAFISLVTHVAELRSTRWTIPLPPDASMAEEVATMGQNWFIHQLKTNGTLQVFNLGRVFADKAILAPVVVALSQQFAHFCQEINLYKYHGLGIVII